MIKEEVGPERLGQQQSLLLHRGPSHPLHPSGPVEVGRVCPPSGVTGDDSLP